MDDSTLPTEDMFPMNEIFVNDVVGSSKTIPTTGVEDEDGFRMDSSEAFAGDEEGDDDLNRVGDESGTKAVDLFSCVFLHPLFSQAASKMSIAGDSASHFDEYVCPTSFIKILVRHHMRLLREIHGLEKEISQSVCFTI
ncbi:hypothetical protein L6452_22681 [Arctium lappa]|uniref:Uncharacterized protein n=1 Tax=Arctium lappa TaxID=4217 RepID=A0ACB9B1B2_ARCLA|nr:hypothetical protein L6452_22681 [Arctium lappa]